MCIVHRVSCGVAAFVSTVKDPCRNEVTLLIAFFLLQPSPSCDTSFFVLSVCVFSWMIVSQMLVTACRARSHRMNWTWGLAGNCLAMAHCCKHCICSSTNWWLWLFSCVYVCVSVQVSVCLFPIASLGYFCFVRTIGYQMTISTSHALSWCDNMKQVISRGGTVIFSKKYYR